MDGWMDGRSSPRIKALIIPTDSPRQPFRQSCASIQSVNTVQVSIGFAMKVKLVSAISQHRYSNFHIATILPHIVHGTGSITKTFQLK